MKLSEYIQNNTCTNYKYVGTIWGDWAEELSKEDILEMLDDLPESDGDILDLHPIYHNKDEGYYLESNRIGYNGYLTQEIVLVEKK